MTENTHPRLEPVDEFHDMRMIQSLQHLQLLIDHLLVSFDILLQNYLDCHFVSVKVCFAYNAVGACSECSTELVLGFLVVAIGLAMEFVDDSSD